MSNASVIHLIDDTTPGGVMRVIDNIIGSKHLAKTSNHRMVVVKKNALKLPKTGVDVIVSHLALNWRNFAARARLRAKYPDVAMIHVEHSYTQGFVAQKVLNKPRFYAMLRSAFSLFDKVIAVSDAQRDWLVRRNLIDADRLTVIQSSVALGEFKALPRRSDSQKVFGLVGRLHEQKGFDIAIRAFRDCPGIDLRLKVFGDGPLRSQLKELAYCDPRITFHGHSEDPLEPMRSIDVLLMPSRWEAYGLVAKEAHAAGRKVIVAPTDGLNDHIKSGAVEVPDHSIVAWTQAISNMAEAGVESTVDQRSLKPRKIKRASRFETQWQECLDGI